jgi:hypothetical protein
MKKNHPKKQLTKVNNDSLLVTLPNNYRIYDPNKLFNEDNKYFDNATKKTSIDISTKDHIKKIINSLWISPENESNEILSDYMKNNNCDFELEILEIDLINDKLILSLQEKGSNTKYIFNIGRKK